MSTAQAANVAISFTGTCDQVFNDDQKQSFRAQILQEVRQSGVCSAGDVLHLCSDESYTVGCDQSGSKRRRRATEPADVLMLISFYLLNRCVRATHHSADRQERKWSSILIQAYKTANFTSYPDTIAKPFTVVTAHCFF